MKAKVSKALLEVWEMKRKVYEETKHLTGAAYFRYIHEEAARLFPDIPRGRESEDGPGTVVGAEGMAPRRVAESRARYGKR